MFSAEDGVGRQVGAAVGVGRCEGFMVTGEFIGGFKKSRR
jgi:hypothetical protein